MTISRGFERCAQIESIFCGHCRRFAKYFDYNVQKRRQSQQKTDNLQSMHCRLRLTQLLVTRTLRFGQFWKHVTSPGHRNTGSAEFCLEPKPQNGHSSQLSSAYEHMSPRCQTLLVSAVVVAGVWFSTFNLWRCMDGKLVTNSNVKDFNERWRGFFPIVVTQLSLRPHHHQL